MKSSVGGTYLSSTREIMTPAQAKRWEELGGGYGIAGRSKIPFTFDFNTASKWAKEGRHFYVFMTFPRQKVPIAVEVSPSDLRTIEHRARAIRNMKQLMVTDTPKSLAEIKAMQRRGLEELERS